MRASHPFHNDKCQSIKTRQTNTQTSLHFTRRYQPLHRSNSNKHLQIKPHQVSDTEHQDQTYHQASASYNWFLKWLRDQPHFLNRIFNYSLNGNGVVASVGVVTALRHISGNLNSINPSDLRPPNIPTSTSSAGMQRTATCWVRKRVSRYPCTAHSY